MSQTYLKTERTRTRKRHGVAGYKNWLPFRDSDKRGCSICPIHCAVPLDKLRLGFSEMTILDALSWMISKDKSNRVQLEEAYNVRPD